MSNSFLDIRSKPPEQRSFLRTDWAVEQGKFDSGRKAFLQGLCSIVSMNEPVRFNFSETSTGENVKSLSDKEVVKKEEKIQENKQGLRAEAVVSTHVPDVSETFSTKVVDATKSPKEEANATCATKELSVVSDDDDIFGELTKSPPTTKTAVIDDDFFSETAATSSSKPLVRAEDSEPFVMPKPVKTAEQQGEALDELFCESQKPTTHVEEPTPTNVQNDNVLKEAEPEVCRDVADLSSEDMEGFDMPRFRRIYAIAQEILGPWLPKDDVEFLARNLGDYSANLNFPHMRDNPHVLSEKLLEVQSKRDALFSITTKLRPAITASKSAASWILSAGMDCSNAKSADKRVSQIKCAIPDFWREHAKMVSVETKVEDTHQHLAGQYECVSRLISLLQLGNKIPEISRQETPFDGGVKVEDTHAKHVEMSQPIAAPKYEACQNFATVAKPSSKKLTAGTIDW